MKIAPLYHELKKREGLEPIIVHTGQHYDLNMYAILKNDPAAGVGANNHSPSAASTMLGLIEHPVYPRLIFSRCC